MIHPAQLHHTKLPDASTREANAVNHQARDAKTRSAQRCNAMPRKTSSGATMKCKVLLNESANADHTIAFPVTRSDLAEALIQEATVTKHLKQKGDEHPCQTCTFTYGNSVSHRFNPWKTSVSKTSSLANLVFNFLFFQRHFIHEKNATLYFWADLLTFLDFSHIWSHKSWPNHVYSL